MHNSNRQLRQVTLTGVFLVKFKHYVLGFMRAEDVGLEEDVWFDKLSSEQIDSIEQYFAGAHRV